jgi:hypothetical protein
VKQQQQQTTVGKQHHQQQNCSGTYIVNQRVHALEVKVAQKNLIYAIVMKIRRLYGQPHYDKTSSPAQSGLRCGDYS